MLARRLRARWRTNISREAVSGSIGNFGTNWRVEAGTPQISKLKPFSKPKQLVKKSRSQAGSKVKILSIARSVGAQLQPRMLSHGLLLAAVAGIVISGSTASSRSVQASLMGERGGYGSVLDTTAAANVAASVAGRTGLLVASEATQTASDLNSQVALLTSGDDDLAKRQVVTTAGAQSRGILNYAVAPGDTLASIASKFNVTTSTLIWANNLADSDALKPGQHLTILPISGLLYSVQAGDTADSLAAKFQSNAAQIISFNNAEVKGLQIGQKIVIPDGVKAAAPRPVTASQNAVASSSAGSPSLTHFSGGANGYSFGYCTWYVASRRSVPSFWGDARNWYYNAQASGFSVGSSPVPGAIAWTGAGYYGHVAYVESVSGGMVTVSEMNYNGNWDRVTYRTVPASSFRYIY